MVDAPAGGTMIEDWSPDSFERELRGRERILVLFYGKWCPFSRVFLPEFERAEPEASVPFARAALTPARDPRWDTYRIRALPTLVYFEHGEELERVDGVPHKGLSKRDLEGLIEDVEAIQEEPALPRHMHGPRRT